MEWLQNNWFWIALVFAFVAMHFFGHGGHDVHGRNDPQSKDNPTDPTHAGHDAALAPTDEKQHRHGC